MPIQEVWVVSVNDSQKYFVETKGEAGRHCRALARELANNLRQSREQQQQPIPEKEEPLFKKQPPTAPGIYMVYGDFGFSECNIEICEFIEQRPSLLNGYQTDIYQAPAPLTRVHASPLPRGKSLEPPIQSEIRPVLAKSTSAPVFMQELLETVAAIHTPEKSKVSIPPPLPETPFHRRYPRVPVTPTICAEAAAVGQAWAPAVDTDDVDLPPLCDTPRDN